MKIQPATNSSVIFERLQFLMKSKFRDFKNDFVENEIELAQMHKKIKDELLVENSIRAITCDAFLDILRGNINSGICKLQSYSLVDADCCYNYLTTLWMLSEYEKMPNAMETALKTYPFDEMVLVKLFFYSLIFGDIDFRKSIVANLHKLKIDLCKHGINFDETANVEGFVMRFIDKTQYKEIHRIALSYAQKHKAYIGQVSQPSSNDFSLIFYVVAKPKDIADMNLELSFELSKRGLLESDLVIGFDYDDYDHLDGATN
ncbi:hypothetical protein [Thorsellia anophelis]|uniref:Uncharacterized protein n=1 Tax=Thorsellia anophelis DSM 18579 TaxID=1123402 RepID=A0A1I0D7R8_9GAMM|nr:hypothetical protein [Thorsellia anophelis]SET27975.1 hypothetical protein SAMN02583745_01875 [Thorsellia anophelis DSM 18579]